MTGAQASYLKTLCEQAHSPEVFKDNLTKAEASKLIDEMRRLMTTMKGIADTVAVQPNRLSPKSLATVSSMKKARRRCEKAELPKINRPS